MLERSQHSMPSEGRLTRLLMLEYRFKVGFDNEERCGLIRSIGGPSGRGMVFAGTHRDGHRVVKGKCDACSLLNLPSARVWTTVAHAL